MVIFEEILTGSTTVNSLPLVLTLICLLIDGYHVLIDVRLETRLLMLTPDRLEDNVGLSLILVHFH